MERAQITGFVNVTSGDLEALKAAVALHGPISVAIDASHRTFSFYSNGVYFDPKCGAYRLNNVVGVLCFYFPSLP